MLEKLSVLMNKMNSTLLAVRSTMSNERLELLISLQANRNRTSSTEKLTEAFVSVKVRIQPLTMQILFNLKWNKI